MGCPAQFIFHARKFKQKKNCLLEQPAKKLFMECYSACDANTASRYPKSYTPAL